jgi:hypothetical protein
MDRAERRRAVRAARKRWVEDVQPLVDEATCDQCGRHLDDGPPDLPTLSVDLGGRVIFACGWCAPALREVLREMTGG